MCYTGKCKWEDYEGNCMWNGWKDLQYAVDNFPCPPTPEEEEPSKRDSLDVWLEELNAKVDAPPDPSDSDAFDAEQPVS